MSVLSHVDPTGASALQHGEFESAPKPREIVPSTQRRRAESQAGMSCLGVRPNRNADEFSDSLPVDQGVVDTNQRIVCTPAYMYDARILEVAAGIDKLVAALLEMLTPQRASN